MRDQHYDLDIAPSFMSYEFVSEGPKGRITKLIKYTETEEKGFYNLGFGDKIEESEEFEDTIISDNKDSERVLATVAATVYLFTKHYPNTYVYAKGSNNARTRLYCIGLKNHLEVIETDFNLFGYINSKWETYQKNRDYTAFNHKKIDNMKKIAKESDLKSPIIKIKESLSKYDTMPVFQKKTDKASAFLKKHPPFEAIKEMENNSIQTYFNEGKTFSEISALMRLSETEVALRLTDMGLLLVEKV